MGCCLPLFVAHLRSAKHLGVNISVSTVTTRLYPDAMRAGDLFRCLYILGDSCSRNNHITLFLCHRIRFHAFQDTATHAPYRSGTFRSSGDRTVQRSICQCCLCRSFHRTIKLLFARSIVHDDQNRLALFDREHFIQVPFYDIDQFSLKKFDRCRHKRQFQYLRNHVCTLFQALKRHNQRTGTGR